MTVMEFASNEERELATALVDRLLGAGLELQVYDGEELTTSVTSDRNVILAALCTTDHDSLIVWKVNEGMKTRSRVGSVLLIWGNGEDLISDYTDTPELSNLLDGWFI